MRFDVHHHHHCWPPLPDPADNPLLLAIYKELQTMSAELDRLTASVAKVKTQDDSIITLVQGLAQQLRDAANDPAAINALADSLDADNQSIADAVSANTPSAGSTSGSTDTSGSTGSTGAGDTGSGAAAGSGDTGATDPNAPA